ncbi:MAG: DUF1972 domain-containing protein [Muribaculaceae bacterium]|nr:DUF1972 domain-containing protein [Muribaculaceae bacterium]
MKGHQQKTRVAIVGSQGIPANYGGFETLVENLVIHASEDVEYTVFCSASEQPSKRSAYHGAELKYLPVKSHGPSSVLYDVWSMAHALRGFDTVLVLGVSGALFIPVLKLFSKAHIIVNVDGIEYQRDKWNYAARTFLRTSLDVSMRWADIIVADNPGVKEFLRQRYGIDAHLIAYGGNQALRETTPEYDKSILERIGVYGRDYNLAICRIEPENHCRLILETHRDLNRELVIVGNWQHSRYSRELFEEFSDIPTIKLVNFIYNLDELHTLRSNASCYVHGHGAGGTNPSLVEAMHFGNPILAYDVIYNRETTGGMAGFFNDKSSLRQLLKKVPANGEALRDYARANYNWSSIAAAYEALY